MRVAVLLPDGVGIRNFLLGGFLRQPEGCGEVWLPSGMDEGLRETYRGFVGDGYVLQTLPPYRESPRAAFFRYSLAYAQMYWGDTQGMRYLLGRPLTGSLRRRLLHRAAKAMGRSMATPRGIRRLDTWHCLEVARRPEVEFYRQAFARERPDVLFCSHQRPPDVLPAVLAARSLGIPTVTFIFSWDNLTSKGRIAAPFDHYLVWSDLMRQEFRRYYPDVAAARVHVVGTPQFDPYADASLEQSRAEFFRAVGADPSRPLICYSGGDHGTSPDDPEHARTLLEHIREGRVRGNPQVLVRPSPVDDGRRYEALRRDFPEMIFAPPRGSTPSRARGRASSRFPGTSGSWRT
jgi:hypothetical protein